MPCTSTLHRDHVKQVSFRLLENRGRSLSYNSLPTDELSDRLLISIVGGIIKKMKDFVYHSLKKRRRSFRHNISPSDQLPDSLLISLVRGLIKKM